jgi:hypothetical protein
MKKKSTKDQISSGVVYDDQFNLWVKNVDFLFSIFYVIKLNSINFYNRNV